jgi:hypothetical protein
MILTSHYSDILIAIHKPGQPFRLGDDTKPTIYNFL